MENFLEIGATVILEGLSAGMDGAVGIVKESTATISETFQTMFGSVERAGAGVVETFREIGAGSQQMAERVVESADAAKLGVEGMAGAFSGLGALLGAGIVGGFLLHEADEAQKLVLELGHLSEQTGIAITTLAGLHAVAEETGISFQSIETALVRLERAQAMAVSGGKMQADAFRRIGISVDEIKGLTPEELFYKVAAAINESASAADTAAAAFMLFGRGGAAIIPLFKEYGDKLKIVVDEHGKLTAVTKDAYESAKQYQQATAQISETWRGMMIPVAQALTWAMEGVIAVFQSAGAIAATFLEGMTNAFRNTVILAETTWTALKAGVTGGTAAMEQAWSTGMAKIEAVNQQSAKVVDQIWLDAYNKITAPFSDTMKAIPLPSEGPAEPKEKAGKDDYFNQLKKQWQDELNIMRTTKQMEAQEENQFWIDKLIPYATQGSEAYHELLKRMGDEHQTTEKLREENEKKFQAFWGQTLKQEEQSFAEFEKEILKTATARALAHVELIKKEQKAILEQEKETAREREKLQDQMAKNFEKLGQYEIFQAKSVSDGLNHVWLTIEEAFAKSLLRMLAQWMSHLIIRLAAHGAEQEGEVAQQEGASLQKRGLDFLDTMKQVTNAAVKAAAGAYDAVVGIPIIGPVLAPIAAGVAFAGVEAFGALASAEGGWDVPRDSLAMIHGGEMVLPAHIAQTVRQGAAEGGGFGTGAGPQFTISYSIQAIDSSNLDQVLRKHSTVLARRISRLVSEGRLTPKMLGTS